jgi:poly-gamma-glutamate synthesis protein (capsule biosynthesis protein)
LPAAQDRKFRWRTRARDFDPGMSFAFDIRRGLIVLLLVFLASMACGGQAQAIPTPPVFVTFTPVRLAPKKIIDSSTPPLLREWVDAIPLVDGEELTLSSGPQPNSANVQTIQWLYVLVAPFPTIRDGVTSDELHGAWNGSLFNDKPLLMAESTLGALKVIWGEPVSGSVRSVSEDQLLDAAWNESAFAIIPFESVSPRWKVMTIDGRSPIQKGFDASIYPLVVSFNLQTSSDLQPSTFNIEPSNYNASKLTTVIITGTTESPIRAKPCAICCALQILRT